MLKKRIIAVVIVKDDIVVQSIGFRKYLPIGKPEIALEFLTSWGIDEIVYLDISATKNQKQPNYDLIRKSAKKCYVPLTVGGGIRRMDQVHELMSAGADKVSLNHIAYNEISFVKEVALAYGNQCVVASIDVVKTPSGYQVYDYTKKEATELNPADYARRLADNGAGEIFLNSVDRDGSYLGYDLDLIQSVTNSVPIPVICCGGAKNASDMVSVFAKTKVSAAAAANFFHFTEHSVNVSKSFVRKTENIRLETHANYNENDLDSELRLTKKDDKILEEMLFLRIEKETI
ncbi:HisA/HisF-related TIM barrel protein [Leptospira bandrabouensis]|uniref:imidazole glycerol phosphate synthase subunit HisF n=1 Tax=Leptospira bandrabouensis TaxID=2484903 RepID=UPI001EE98AC6|nr:HisA/HisF-related TIM barrel protein [Leptospira bandrabouensis]MCG6144960.1 imidazole glycerol phosphate synthase subunit HisF [Leptospira bandrabouensis]MCG6160403.1 imidazole glycerol phosphate synthase subunit HisF [Leptospira bandrabouensis]MCG6164335.1 imidazole glycerol phosphate synthase subunit HisF [Leptospira bandrabouensis]MCW7460307.1 HisA/HisF-related TIM barrel protein [Leptospira bandrabouensis]MCW7478202.1 HisA/HisF-related TIM barrel protein [Leptospira bandrabouensis]